MTAAHRAEIIIIDADTTRSDHIRSVLNEEGYAARCVRNVQRGFQLCLKNRPELVFLGFGAPGLNEFRLLEKFAAHEIGPVVLIAEPADMGELAAALRAGAQEVLPSTFEDRQLVDVVEKVARESHGPPERQLVERSLIGQSPGLREVRRRVLALGSLSVPALISGEKGTGRRHTARLLHSLREQSRVLRIAGPGEPIPEPRRHETLYVPEVEALSASDQLRLLRCVERQDSSPLEAGAVIAATTRDPRELSSFSTFQRSLADRLSRFDVLLPSLRDRLSDVRDLSRYFAERHARHLGRQNPQITLPALRVLEEHSWPGNLTELAKLMERLVAFSTKHRIDADLARSALSQMATPVALSRNAQSRREREELLKLIESTGGNLAEVARRLKLSRGAVIYRAQKYGLLAPRRPQRENGRDSGQDRMENAR